MAGFERIALLSLAAFAPSSAIASDGAAVFAQNCALCHQSGATGLPGQIPRLAGRVDRISRKAPGRRYLIHVVTYGMAGRIQVDDDPIIGVMPPLALSAEDATAVLNYLQGLGGPRPAAAPHAEPFTPEEVTAERAKPAMNGIDVHAERQSLLAARVID